MKLVITVSDDRAGEAGHGSGRMAQEDAGAVSGDGQQPMETFDGGPVPETLLAMESEVAAGQRPAPGGTR